MASHKSLKRIVRRSVEEMKATCEIAKYTSAPDAFTTFLAKIQIQIMNRNGFLEPPHVKKLLLKKHEVMLRYFENKYTDFLHSYDRNRDLPDDDPALRDRIWICWWQGLENAPELVQRCVESVIRNSGNHTVTILTEENYKEYVHIPQWVEEKFRKGIISRTHYSDMLRLSLLSEHGGMWLDATFFCTAPVLDCYFQMPLWSVKRQDYLHVSVACGRFATYSLCCPYDNRWIFATIRDFVTHYWKGNDILIDYLFLDYLFALSQRKDPKIAELFSDIEANNPRCDDLVAALEEPYNAQKWQEMTAETSLFKLTWKQEFPAEVNGEKTFYGKLLERTL